MWELKKNYPRDEDMKCPICIGLHKSMWKFDN